MKEEIKLYKSIYEIDLGTQAWTDTTWRNTKSSSIFKAGEDINRIHPVVWTSLSLL